MRAFTFMDVAFVAGLTPASSVVTEAVDTLESYVVEDPLTQTLNGGSGWSAAWSLPAVEIGLIYSQDTLETYTVEDPLTQTLSAGSGWSAAWVVV